MHGRRKKLFRPRSTFQRRVKAVVNRMSETKEKHQPQTFNFGSAFFHDILYECKLATTTPGDTGTITYIAGGNAESNRSGTDIYTIGFAVRGQFCLPYDRRSTTIKIWLVEYNTNQGTPTASGQFFRAVTGNDLIDPINTDAFPGVKLLRTLRGTSRDMYTTAGAGGLMVINYNMWIPFRRRLRYNSNAATQPTSGMKENLSLVMVAYDTNNTLQTSIVVEQHVQRVSIYYKDM